jgi:hypothetical protein
LLDLPNDRVGGGDAASNARCPEICRDAITRPYDLRFWNVPWLLIEVAAGAFANARRPHAAAIRYGHLEGTVPWAIWVLAQARARSLDRVRQLTHFDSLMVRRRRLLGPRGAA